MMQSVLTWLKSNVLIVVLCFLTLILPPAGIVGASMWNSSIRESVEKAYKTEEQSLTGPSRVSYSIPSITATGEDGWEEKTAPNRVLTDFVKKERDRRQAEIERTLEAAVKLNKGESRDVLVRGLFPGVADARVQSRLINELKVTLGGGEDPTTSAYAGLFNRIGAGMPPRAASVARKVVDVATTARDSGSLDTGDPEEAARQLNESLVAVRLAEYRARAEEISVYASVSALTSGSEDQGPRGAVRSLPLGLPDPAVRPTAAEAYVWQWDYWLVEDLLKAVRLANTSESGISVPVTEAVIKRIESIAIDQLATVEEAGNTSGTFGNPRSGFGAPGGDPAADNPFPIVKLSRAPTYTGRATSALNQTYDVRTARMTLVVDSSRLQEIFDAFAAVNFMTITDLRFSEIDRAAELSQGFYYGEDHVMRAQIEIESVWLRYWTVPNAMPEALRTALGVTQVFEQEATDEAAQEPSP